MGLVKRLPQRDFGKGLDIHPERKGRGNEVGPCGKAAAMMDRRSVTWTGEINNLSRVVILKICCSARPNIGTLKATHAPRAG